jgi:hypothetical protein
MPSPLPLVLTPGKDLFYLPVLNLFFFKYIDSLRGFEACVYHALIKLTPRYLLFLCHHAPLIQQLTVCYITLYSYRWVVSVVSSIYHFPSRLL